MWVSPTLCERGGTIEVTVVATARVTSTVARRCYQMVTIATGEDMMSRKTVATEATAATGGSVTSPRSHCRNRSQDVCC
jgi:hypothetical protein